MSDLITLTKNDKNFETYLLGTFSKTQRALPVQSLNISTENEIVTFKIVDISNIFKPNKLQFILELLRVRYWIFVALPIAMLLIKAQLDQSLIDPSLVIMNLLGAFFLMSSLNLRNDFQDHYWGLDRIHDGVRIGAIQKGWVSAYDTKLYSRFLLITGIILGLPSVFLFPNLLILILTISLLLILSTGLHQLGMKYRLGTEFASFFLAGPLLTLGYQISIGGKLDLEVLIIGFFTGGLTMFLLYLKNFEFIMINSKANFRNTMIRFGFEKSKFFLKLFWSVGASLFALFRFFYGIGIWRWVVPICCLLITVKIIKTLNQAQSPAGSTLSQAILKSRSLVWFLVAVWLIEQMSYILVVELGS
jgi:1,4-dihydroxy-2-naphthoate polyprenyltransferase